MTLEWFLTWWNLIFIVPFFLALLYLGLYVVSGVTFGEAEADADLDADADVDVDADAEAEIEAEAEVEAEVEAEAEAEADLHSQVPLHLALLGWLGLGRVPVSILLMVLLVSWGVTGFMANMTFWQSMPQGISVAAISLPLAAVVSLLVTRLVSSLVARYLPTHETYARRRHELLGADGEAVLPIDHDGGLVAVHDEYGDRYQFGCRVYRDTPAIPKGTRVRLVAYNAKQGLFYAVPVDSPKTQGSSS